MSFKELNYIPSVLIFLVLIGALVGVGITIFDKMGDINRQATITTENKTILYGESVAFLNSKVSTDTISCINNSISMDSCSSYLSFDKTGTYAANSYSVAIGHALGTGFNNTNVNISYTYGAASSNTNAMNSASGALDDIVDWLPIIIIVTAASVVLVLLLKGSILSGKER